MAAPRDVAETALKAAAKLFHHSKTDEITAHAAFDKYPQEEICLETFLRDAAELERREFFVIGETTVEDVEAELVTVYEEQPEKEPAVDFADKMTTALLEHAETNASWVKLARKYKIARKTLAKYHAVLGDCLPRLVDRSAVKQRVIATAETFKANVGAKKRHFSPAEEMMLVGFVQQYEEASGPLEKKRFIEFVRVFLEKRCQLLQQRPPANINGWYRRFMQRHEDRISLRKTTMLGQPRALAQDSQTLNGWSKQVHDFEKSLIREGRLPPSGFAAHQILNFDEASAHPQGKAPRVYVHRSNDDANTEACAEHGPSHVTYSCLTSAAGELLTVQVIHTNPKEQLNQSSCDGLVSPTTDVNAGTRVPVFVSTTSKGCQTTHSFMRFMEHALHTLTEFRNNDPRCNADTVFVIFMDNHFSRWCGKQHAVAVYEKCLLHGVFVSFLPAHLSHVLQPNDLGLHSHLKETYSSKLDEDIDEEVNHGLRPLCTRMTRQFFNDCLLKAIDHIASNERSSQIIANGFRKAGLMPLQDVPGFETMEFPEWFCPEESVEGDESDHHPDVDDAVTQDSSDNATVDDVHEMLVPDEPGLASQTPACTPPSLHALQLEYLKKQHTELAEFGQRRLQLEAEYGAAAADSFQHNRKQPRKVFGFPDLLLQEMRSFVNIPRPASPTRKRKVPWSIAGCADGNEALASIRAAVETELESSLSIRTKRLERHKKQPLFRAFCEARGYLEDIFESTDNATVEELLQLSDEYAEETRDKGKKAELQSKLSASNTTAPAAEELLPASTEPGRSRKRSRPARLAAHPSIAEIS